MDWHATSGVYKNPIYSLFSWLDEYVPIPLLCLITTALMLFLTSGPPVFVFSLQEGPAQS